MFELFTEHARKVIVGAQEEVVALGHDELGTEHLLLGVLRLEQGHAASALRNLDVTQEWVRERVIALDGLHEKLLGGRQIPFTVEAKRALQSAVREARQAGAEEVMPEHLLVALVTHTDSLSARILFARSIGAAAVRAALYDREAGAGADVSTTPRDGQHEDRDAALDDSLGDPDLDLDLAEVLQLIPRLAALADGIYIDARRYRDETPALRIVCEPRDGEQRLSELLELRIRGFLPVLAGGRVVRIARDESLRDAPKPRLEPL